MRIERIKQTFALAYMATGIAQVCEIAYNYSLYKSFPVDEIGLFAWAAAIIVFFNMSIDMGVEPILTRKFGNDRLRLKQAMMATFLPRTPIILIGAAIIIALSQIELLDSSQFWMLLLVGAQSLFNVWDGVCKAWLRAHGYQSKANFLAALLGILKLIAITVLVVVFSGTIFHLLASLLIVRSVGSLFAYTSILKVKQDESEIPDQALLGVSSNLLKAGIVVGGISLLTAAQNRLDWLMISHFISTDALAGYSLANKFYEISQVLIGAALTTIYPWLCRTDTNIPMLFVVMRLVVTAGAVLAACGVILGPPLIGILFAEKYSAIGLPVVILMLASGVIAANGVFYQSALARGRERLLLIVTIVTTVLQALSNLWLIPRLGITGAALGMLVLAVATSIGLSFVVWRCGVYSGSAILRILIFIGLFLCSTAVVVFLALPVWIAVSSCVISLSLFAWWLLFERDERQMLKTQLLAILS